MAPITAASIRKNKKNRWHYVSLRSVPLLAVLLFIAIRCAVLLFGEPMQQVLTLPLSLSYDESTLRIEAIQAASSRRLKAVRKSLFQDYQRQQENAKQANINDIALNYPSKLLENANAKIFERRGWLSSLHRAEGALFSEVKGAAIWYMFPPVLPCLWTMEKTPGSVLRHDGGKWLCALHEVHLFQSSSSNTTTELDGPEGTTEYGVGNHYHISNHHHPQPPSAQKSSSCVVYSIGSNNEFSFEKRVRSVAPGCEIHTFDPTVKETGRGKDFYDAYHGEYGLGGIDKQASKKSNTLLDEFLRFTKRKQTASSTAFPLKSLSTIMSELRHDHVDYLKIDIEGYEWDVLATVDWTTVKIGQILIELHPAASGSGAAYRIGVTWDPTAFQINAVFSKLEVAGFYLMSLEPVTFGNLGQVELVFIHKDWRPNGQHTW